jgi:hypothetical protein
MARRRRLHRRRVPIIYALVFIMMSVFIARHRGFALAFACSKSSSSRVGLLGRRTSVSIEKHLFSYDHDAKIRPSFYLRNFSENRKIENASSLEASRDGDTVEKTIVSDFEDDAATVASSKIQAAKEAKPPGWRKRLQRRAGGVLSAVGFATSATRALVTHGSKQWKPSVDALRSFLKTTGIDLELSALLNVRLLDNIILLSRIENAALKGKDRRDLALCSETSSPLPTDDEALR